LATMLSEIRVEFRGEGEGAAELTWGQMGMWRNTQRYGASMNLAWMASPPEGATLAEIADMLRFMVSRQPMLRTRLRFVDGPSGERRPQQVVAAAGEVTLQVADIADGDDPAAVAEELRDRYANSWFDYEHEFPVWMGVIRQAGALVYLVFGFSHVLVDGSGLDLVFTDLEHLDRATGEATAPARGMNPLDLARWQGSPAGRRQSNRANRYWAAQLARLPAWPPAGPAPQDGPPIAELMVYSPAMELGMRAVAARTDADGTSVLLAAYAAACARVFGRDPAVALLVVGNRFRPGLADMVSQVAQHGICVVDVTDATFDEVVARARKATTSASFYSYYDPVAFDQVVEEAAALRPPDIQWWINDLRGMATSPGGNGALPSEAELARVLPRTTLSWNPKVLRAHGPLYLFVDSGPGRFGVAPPEDGLPGIYMKVWADTQLFALDQVEALIREMEAVVAKAASTPRAPLMPERQAGTRASAAPLQETPPLKLLDLTGPPGSRAGC
jgi:Condensation domain